MQYVESQDLISFTILAKLPSYFNGVDGFQYSDITVLNANGFYIYEAPTFDPQTQKIGDFTFDTNTKIVSRAVVSLTPEEIELNTVSFSEQKAVEQAQEVNILLAQDAAQNLPDIAAKNVPDVYPLWNGLSFDYNLDFKVKYPVGPNMLLYKCVQAHTSQPTFDPPTVPALWTQIPLTGQILPWRQPTGPRTLIILGTRLATRALFTSPRSTQMYLPLEWCQANGPSLRHNFNKHPPGNTFNFV